jgi:predicted transcriptional regulator
LSKRRVLDILIKVYDALPPDREFTINEVAKKVHITWRVAYSHIHALQALGIVGIVQPNTEVNWHRVKWRAFNFE